MDVFIPKSRARQQRILDIQKERMHPRSQFCLRDRDLPVLPGVSRRATVTLHSRHPLVDFNADGYRVIPSREIYIRELLAVIKFNSDSRIL
jgi:hypothetical protein